MSAHLLQSHYLRPKTKQLFLAVPMHLHQQVHLMVVWIIQNLHGANVLLQAELL